MSADPRSAREVAEAIGALLARQHAMSLATVDEQGQPHAASLLFATDGLALLWTSSPASRHSRHIERQASVGATIAPDCADFRRIQGVQVHGLARRLSTPGEIADAQARLRARYPYLDQLALAPPSLLALWRAWRDAAFYRLEPRCVTLIDNTRGFGHKETLRVTEGGMRVMDA